MAFREILFLALLSFEVVLSIPLKDEKNQPVDLYHVCMTPIVPETEQNKSPILLIHGLATTSSNWDGVKEVLAISTGRRLCTVDLRNHGNSPWSNQSDINVMTADIGQFLDKENIQKVNIIGHSLGGKIALHYTLNNPERVDSLVVEDMRPNSISAKAMAVIKEMVQLLQAGMRIVPHGSSEDQARNIIVGLIKKQLKEFDLEDQVDERIIRLIPINCLDEICRYGFNLDLLGKVINEPLPESKGLYTGPTLFIYGTRSMFSVAEDKRNIQKLFPNAKLVGVTGAGHAIHGVFREFEDEVIKFLNNLKL